MKRRRTHYGRRPSKEFGACLRTWREAVHLTQDAAARQLGIESKNAGAYLSMIERGERSIPEAALLNVSKVYRVPPNEVLERAYWPQLILLHLIAIIDPERLSRDLIEELEKGLEEEERREITRHVEELLRKRSTVEQH